ncbi:hypothetical protein RI367_007810 [Sorochytrium milnesiophthora]
MSSTKTTTSRWTQVPQELQLAILDRADAAAALTLQNIWAAKRLIRRDLPSANSEEQSRWWAAVLYTGWLDGAQLLLDMCVPYLPSFCEKSFGVTTKQLASYHSNPVLVQLLCDDDMLAAFSDSSNDGRAASTNMHTKFALALRIPAQDARRVSIVADQWHKAGERQRVLIHDFRAPRDIDLMQQLIPPDMMWPSKAFVADQHADPDEMRAALQWLFDKSGVKFDPVQLVNTAAMQDNVPALAWLYNHVDKPHLRAAEPTSMAMCYNRLAVLRWLHTYIGIPCSYGCSFPSTARRLPCDHLDDTALRQFWGSSEHWDWVQANHPHLPLDRIAVSALYRDLPDVMQWVREHAADHSWMTSVLVEAVRCGKLDIATALMNEHPSLIEELPAEAWHSQERGEWHSPLNDITDTDSASSLDWLLAHQPEAIGVLCVDTLMFKWSPSIIEWLTRHPEHAPWSPADLAPGERVPRWVVEVLDQEMEMFGPWHRPWASRALYHVLCSENVLPGREDYFGLCAVRKRDIDWLLEIAHDYGLDQTDYVERVKEAGSSDESSDCNLVAAERFPLFVDLVARGIQLRPSMLADIPPQNNVAGAVWIMERLDPALDWGMATWDKNRGNLGLLQLACERGQRLCRTCLTLGAEKHCQYQILRWSHQRQTADLWRACDKHSNS